MSSWTIASGACSRAARSRPRTTKSALAGPIAPATGITTMGARAAAAAPATAAHASSRPISTAARASRAGSLPRAGGGRGEERGMGIAVSAGGARPHGAAPQPGRGKGVRPVLKE
ncbi:putative nodulation efficiency protein D [Burkholderia pseudomallei]|nr:putative nodulation efficiency protein D [Burkholderia pseudomallei]